MKEVNNHNPAQNDNFHVILVESQESLNVGSVARAMMNVGFSQLHLVSPRGYKKEKALLSACAAAPIVDTARLHGSLEKALTGMADVVGFSARSGKNRPLPIDVRQWAEKIRTKPQKIALVFGPEDTGLRNEHLLLCRTIVKLPASSENTSYNLAQAVLLALYEIQFGNRVQSTSLPCAEMSEELPPWEEQIQLGKLVDETLWASGFYREETPKTMPTIVRNLIFRISPNKRELATLLGMFQSIKHLIGVRR